MTYSSRDDSDDFHSLFVNNVPLLDVRAPAETLSGTLPGAHCLPLLDDNQRHVIGTEYARNGEQAAIALGEQLATADIRQQRVAAWTEFVKRNPDGYLYCFRGGLRSRISQSWLADAGHHYPRIIGGYKAMRTYLIEQLDRLGSAAKLLVVSGRTGCGKTDFLHGWPHSVDLEGLARHRGSAFGGTFTEQPAQASWENELAVRWLRVESKTTAPVLFEAESHLIGRISLPECLQRALQRADVIVLESTLRERVERIRRDYVEYSLQHYRQLNPETALQNLQENILHNLQRIQRRLGGQRFKQLSSLLPDAVEDIRQNRTWHHFEQIIETLLIDYYDPLYQHKFDTRDSKVMASGSAAELREWLEQRYASELN